MKRRDFMWLWCPSIHSPLMRAGFKSTLFTGVEQHYRRRPKGYSQMLHRYMDGEWELERCIRFLLEEMAANSRLACWFRGRSARLRQACGELGLPPKHWEAALIDFDFGGLPNALSQHLSGREDPWHTLRSSMSQVDSVELAWQLERLRQEEERARFGS